ncbi:MAG: hypothetical protein ACI9KE_006141, partial [Polyangiales bacterium]
RVFAIDIMPCPHCQGVMRVKSIATEADEIRAVLGTIPRARAPPPLRQTLGSGESSWGRILGVWRGFEGLLAEEAELLFDEVRPAAAELLGLSELKSPAHAMIRRMVTEESE